MAYVMRKHCTLVTDDSVLDFIARLASLEWDGSLAGVGHDAQGLGETAIEIRQVFHVQNMALATRYQAVFQQAVESFQIPVELTERIVATMAVKPEFSTDVQLPYEAVLQRQSCRLNETEVFLFHGTDKRQVKGLLKGGFRLKFAKRGLYGHPAVYMSKHAQKADIF